MGGEPGQPAGGDATLVSVVIPCHDAADTIERAIASARAQTHPAVEIVAVDDASSDATRERLEALAGDDLRVLHLAENVGPAEARNRGIAASRGEYVAFLDADDEWYPEKLAAQVAVLDADSDCALATCDSVLVEVDGSTRRHHTTTPTASGPEAWRTLLGGNFVPTPTVLTRRALLEEVGGFDRDLPLGEDYDLWLRLALRGGVHVDPEPRLTIYARAEGLSRTYLRGEIDYVMPMIERHLEAVGDRLGGKEKRALVGRNSFEVGLRARLSGYHAEAALLFVRSALVGHRVPKSLYQLALCLAARVLGGRHRPLSDS